jgi:3-oxoadipate enol-lactonase
MRYTIEGGVALHVRERGGGTPALLFLHYYGGTSRTWDGVTARLSDHHHTIAFDARGWGASDAPPNGYTIAQLADDALALIRALHVERFVVIGHSMGGKVAQKLAARRPAGLEGLVLIAPAAARPTVLDAFREQVAHAYDSAESIVWSIDNVLTALPLIADQRRAIVEDSLGGSIDAKRAWPEHMMLESFEDELARISVPTLVLAGERDRVEPADLVRREVVARIPDARSRMRSPHSSLPPGVTGKAKSPVSLRDS